MKKAKKSIPDLLSEAFELQDWTLVDAAYNMLTGQNLIEEDEVVVKPKAKTKSKKVPKASKTVAKSPKTQKAPKPKNLLDSNNMAPIGGLREMVFYNEGTTTKGRKLSQTVAKKAPKGNMPPRPDYKPNMCKCNICGASFDYNKEYPAGQFGDRNVLKCNKCKGVSK